MPRVVHNPTLLERMAKRPRVTLSTLAATVAGGALLALMSPSSEAEQPRNGIAAATDTGDLALATPTAQPDEQCPAELSPIIPDPGEYPFPVDPSAQQQVLQDLDFQIGRTTADGVFKERTLTSLNELRQLYYGGQRRSALGFTQTMSEREYRDLSQFARDVRTAASQNSVEVGVMANTALAARATGMQAHELLAMTDQGQAGFRGSLTDLLYLVKNYGHRFGMGALADSIEMEREGWFNATYSLRVNDPVALMMLDQLRQYPRTAMLFEAQRITQGTDMPATQEMRGAAPDGDLAAIKANLATLGVDNLLGQEEGYGLRTEAAMNLYRATYGRLVPEGESVDEYLARFADLARRDAQTYERLSRQRMEQGRVGSAVEIPTQAAAAIRLGSLRTGADFEYMMKLAYAESTFDHEAGAPTSSAQGLYQFIEDTWVQTASKYGRNNAMGIMASHYSVLPDMNGYMVGRSENPWMRIAGLGLRDQPQLAALMSAEFQLDNQWRMECHLGRTLVHEERYMGHFMGYDQGARFLERRDEMPTANATVNFQTQAASNPWVFRTDGGDGRQRSLEEVVDAFGAKFNRYDFADRSYNLQVTFNVNAAARERSLRDQRVAQDATRAGFPMTAQSVRELGVVAAERRGPDIVLEFDPAHRPAPPAAATAQRARGWWPFS